jgi:hypothetical protein
VIETNKSSEQRNTVPNLASHKLTARLSLGVSSKRKKKGSGAILISQTFTGCFSNSIKRVFHSPHFSFINYVDQTCSCFVNNVFRTGIVSNKYMCEETSISGSSLMANCRE